MSTKKRVVCFYRVSTKKQMTEEDIPMQRNACLKFIAAHEDWEYVKEYSEKGVSGYKVKAEKREVLEQLRTDAVKNQFDAVLVFMFDRLGRIEEETPYVLKWFIDHGIEMWSVKEGQRVLDNHTDTLINYITFWQAEGESKKIQQRTLEAKKQMADAGKYLGGPPPYGYTHISTGDHNAKGREIKKLVIKETEAEIVRRIFDLCYLKGFGSRRIAQELNQKRIVSKKGKQWSGSTIMGILKNTIYKGYFTYGRNTNTFMDKKYTNQSQCRVSKVRYQELAIIPEEQWEEVQNIIKNRAGMAAGNIPRQTKSPLLLTGLAYCRYCGARLTLHYSYSKAEKGKNSKERKAYYICYGRRNGQNDCCSGYYPAERIEGGVLEEISGLLSRMKKVDFKEALVHNFEAEIAQGNRNMKGKCEEIQIKEKELKLLKSEIINTLKGSSKFTEELLLEQIQEVSDRLDSEKAALGSLEDIIFDIQAEIDKIQKEKKMIPIWMEEFYSLENERIKMLLAKIINAVYVGKDDITLQFKLTAEEYMKP